MPDFNCLRCGTPMRFAGRDKLQLGKTSWLFGDLPNLMAGALEVSIMACPACGKLEFFTGGAVRRDGNDPDLHRLWLLPRLRLPQMPPLWSHLHRGGRIVSIL